METPIPPPKSSLAQWQQFVQTACAELGWNKNSHLEIFLLLSEEVGELAQAVRYHTALHTPAHKQADKAAIATELADVLNYIADLANYFDIDLDEALRQKWHENAQRSWE